MIQIKTFNMCVDEEVNDFIRKNPNCKILQTNPIIIQYESLEDAEYFIPNYELYAKSCYISFVLTTDEPVDNERKGRHLFASAFFITSKILIFKDYIHFFTDEINFYSNKKGQSLKCKFVEFNKLENCFYVNNKKVDIYITNDIDDGKRFETKLHALVYHDDYYRFTNVGNMKKSFEDLEEIIHIKFEDLFGFVETKIITYFNKETQTHKIIY